MNLKKKIFPIYTFLLSCYQSKERKMIYINLMWVIMITSWILGSYFTVHHIDQKMAEYKHMEENYSHYNGKSIELSVPEYIQPALDNAKENPRDILHVFRYYQIQINDIWGQKTDDFNKILLKKSANSENWVLQIPDQRSKSTLSSADPLLYNSEWRIIYEIDMDELLTKKMGDYNLYFDYVADFRDQKIYGLLTWSPSWLIHLLNGFAVIWIYIHCLLICAVSAGITLWLARITWKNHEKMDRQGMMWYSGNMTSLKKFLNHAPSSRHIILKGMDNLYLFPPTKRKGGDNETV